MATLDFKRMGKGKMFHLFFVIAVELVRKPVNLPLLFDII